MKSDTKLALAMIVNGIDDEATPLNQCLSNISQHVDGIFLTLTHKKGEKVSEQVKKIARLYNAEISEFEWVYDFSAARNFNFSQVPDDYTHILWLDADDVVRGAEHIREAIDKHPQVDAFSMFYLYHFDEYNNPDVVHQKTQIVKRGCVEWAGRIHEDFKPKRALNTHFIKGVERMHLSEDDRRMESRVRNLEVAEKQAEADPDDPRSYWNLGNAQKAAGKTEDAVTTLKKFLETSRSDDEKYIVRLRLAECYWTLKQYSEAIETAQTAVGIKPHYPDAYHLLGSLYFEAKRYKESIASYLQGLTKKPPYYDIIVYNPRDYDYVPMNNLAKVYFAMNRPDMALPLLEGCLKIQPKDERLRGLIKAMKKEVKEFEGVLEEVKKLIKIKDKKKLKAALDKVPKEFQSAPAICNIRNTNFIKEESSGKDLVFYCGYTEKVWLPETAKTKGVGGSEEAVIHLSKRLVKKGWNVTVYNNCGHEEQVIEGVTYKPFWTWNYRDKQDVVILWRSLKACDYNINSEKVFIDLHDVIEPGEITEDRLQKVDKIFVKSKFHRSLYPHVPDDMFVIVPNGIVSDDFKDGVEKDDMLIVNTSSPDRSLTALIKAFKIIKKEVPDAKCKWAYGWGVFDIVHGDDPNIMAWKRKVEDELEEVGIENLGMVSHGEVRDLYQKANVFLYPTEFAEIDCISLTKAWLGGAYPVTTDFGSLGDKNQHGFFVHSEKTKDNWCLPYQHDFSLEDDEKIELLANKTIEILKGAEKDRTLMREYAIKNYDWDVVTNKWNEELNGKI